MLDDGSNGDGEEYPHQVLDGFPQILDNLPKMLDNLPKMEDNLP